MSSAQIKAKIKLLQKLDAGLLSPVRSDRADREPKKTKTAPARKKTCTCPKKTAK